MALVVLLTLCLAQGALAAGPDARAEGGISVEWNLAGAVVLPADVQESCHVLNSTDGALTALRLVAVNSMSGERVALDYLEELGAGESAELDGLFRVEDAADWRFLVTARNAAGEDVEERSEMIAFGRGVVLMYVDADTTRLEGPGTVTLSWTVVNDLQADIHALNATLVSWQDGAEAGQPIVIESRETLGPGETWTFQTPVEVRQTGRYVAKLAYAAPDGKNDTRQLAPFELAVNPQVWEAQWRLASSQTVPATVRQQCSVRNISATSLENLSFEAVSENGQGTIVLATLDQLATGETAQLAGTMEVTEAGEWSFLLKGEHNGETYEQTADRTCAFGEERLVLHATSSDTELVDAGTASIHWSATNCYAGPITDLVASAVPCSQDGTVSPGAQGVQAGTRESLATGEEWSLDSTIDVTTTRSYLFIITFTDPEGGQGTAQSGPMRFTVQNEQRVTLAMVVQAAQAFREGKTSLTEVVRLAEQLAQQMSG